MILSRSVCQYVSVGKRVFSKTADRIFLKLLMKLGSLKGKKLRKQILGKQSHFWDNAQKHPQEGGILDFAKK